jgi:hypothetical protein
MKIHKNKNPVDNKCLAFTHPAMLFEWDFDKNTKSPYDISYGTKHKMWWKCKNGHSWMSNILNRIRGNGCPFCSHRYASKENNLTITNPVVSKEWNYKKNVTLRPEEVVSGSTKKVWWICGKGHEWKTSIANRASKHNKNNCPYCANRKLCKENSLEFVDPLLASEWDLEKNNPVLPKDVLFGSYKSFWWKCRNGHEWEASLSSRRKGCGCPFCSKIELVDGACVNSLIEAWYYLLLKENGISFEYNKRYSKTGSRHRFDFYIPEIKTYIEVTSFSADIKHKSFKYQTYLDVINYKRKIIESNSENFEFIQRKLSRPEIYYIKQNIKR